MPHRIVRCAAAVALVLAALAAQADEPRTITVKVRVVNTDNTNKRVCLAEDDGSQTWYEINPAKGKHLEVDGKAAFVFNLKKEMTGVLVLPRDPKATGFTLSLNSLAAKAAPALPPGANATLIDKNGKMYPIWVPNGTPGATYGLSAAVRPTSQYWSGGPSMSSFGYGYGPPQGPQFSSGNPFAMRSNANYPGYGFGTSRVTITWTEEKVLQALLAHVVKEAAVYIEDPFWRGAFRLGATLWRDASIEEAIRGYFPELSGFEVRFVCRFITLTLDGELSKRQFALATAKDELIEYLKADCPTLATNIKAVDLLVKFIQATR